MMTPLQTKVLLAITRDLPPLHAEVKKLLASHERLLGACKALAAGPVDEPQIDLVGDYQKGLFCGLEDRGEQSDGYAACLYGFNEGVERALEWAQGEVHDAIAEAPAEGT